MQGKGKIIFRFRDWSIWGFIYYEREELLAKVIANIVELIIITINFNINLHFRSGILLKWFNLNAFNSQNINSINQ